MCFYKNFEACCLTLCSCLTGPNWFGINGPMPSNIRAAQLEHRGKIILPKNFFLKFSVFSYLQGVTCVGCFYSVLFFKELIFSMTVLNDVFQAAVQDRLNEQEGVPSVFNPPPSRPLQVNTADHRVYSYIVSRPQPRVGLQVL